jgi:hypothetical protein
VLQWVLPHVVDPDGLAFSLIFQCICCDDYMMIPFILQCLSNHDSGNHHDKRSLMVELLVGKKPCSTLKFGSLLNEGYPVWFCCDVLRQWQEPDIFRILQAFPHHHDIWLQMANVNVLHLAARTDNVSVTTMLMASGIVNPFVLNGDGKMAVELTTHPEIVALLNPVFRPTIQWATWLGADFRREARTFLRHWQLGHDMMNEILRHLAHAHLPPAKRIK